MEIAIEIAKGLGVTKEASSIDGSIIGKIIMNRMVGNKNVEVCWGFPYLKIKRFGNYHFMFFDRYAIDIQYFVNFI